MPAKLTHGGVSREKARHQHMMAGVWSLVHIDLVDLVDSDAIEERWIFFMKQEGWVPYWLYIKEKRGYYKASKSSHEIKKETKKIREITKGCLSILP